jgi:threonine dehydratase
MAELIRAAAAAATGSSGLEIVEQVDDVSTVVVPVSGGGLISGIATAVRALVPTARIVGVSMAEGAVMYESLRAGHPVELPEAPTFADSLQGGIGLQNDTSFPIVRDLVEEIVLVDEDAIRDAMAYALAEHGVVLEGAGAVGIAAVRSQQVTARGDGALVIVCSGRNAEPGTIAELAADTARARLIRQDWSHEP